MFKSVHIQNFRQFKDLKLDGLAQINLITGKNNTGKTSLLEALFLLLNPDDPTRTVTLAGLRGTDRLSPDTPELWELLFRDRVHWESIEIVSEDVDGHRSHLEIRLQLPGLLEASIDERTGGLTPLTVKAGDPLPELVYDHSPSSGQHRQHVFRWTEQGLRVESTYRRGSRGPKSAYYLSDSHRPGELDADRLSRLEEVGREGILVEGLKIIEPRLRRLTVLTHGGRPSVYSDLGGLPLMPLANMGQGFSRLLTIISALSITDGATILIDELDGFHYSMLADVWRVIVASAIRNRAQVFVTTHSLEVIQAAVEGSEGHEGSLAFFRLERREEDINVVAGEDFRLRAAASVGTELR